MSKPCGGNRAPALRQAQGEREECSPGIKSGPYETALQEYQQLSSLMPPGTLVSYTVQVNPIVDFSRGFDGTHWPPIWDAFHDDWRHLWFDRHVEPASWVAADEVLEAGAKGILFGSHMRPGGLNLVLYTEALESTDVLQVHDPRNDLPKNQDSWR